MDDLTALLLEPDDQIRELVTRILENAGFEVTAVVAGDHAVAALATRDYDALIIDISIRASALEDGVRRGVGFLHYLEREHPDVLERVVVTSALSERELLRSLPRVSHILTKPFDINELEAAAIDCARTGESASR